MSEALWRDRATRPPPLTEIYGIPLSDYMPLRVWSVDGKQRLKTRMPIRGNRVGREAKNYVGKRPPKPESPELSGNPDDPIMEYPYILSDHKESLVTLLEIACPGYEDYEKNFLREALVAVTIPRGWAAPIGGYNSRDLYPSPGITRPELLPPWSWLLSKEDYEYMHEEDIYALPCALGYDPPIGPP